jgi:hypothetical protein
VLLRRLRADLVDAQYGLSTRVPPLTLVTQFEDVLTHRLLTLQRDLLEPAPHDEPEGGDDVENLVLHRNQLETAALATAALGGAAWTIIRRLLDPDDHHCCARRRVRRTQGARHRPPRPATLR